MICGIREVLNLTKIVEETRTEVKKKDVLFQYLTWNGSESEKRESDKIGAPILRLRRARSLTSDFIRGAASGGGCAGRGDAD
jgi:hypothetical protein